MVEYDYTELMGAIAYGTRKGYDIETDNKGQVIIYTGLFKWNDGKFRDRPDPDFEE